MIKRNFKLCMLMVVLLAVEKQYTQDNNIQTNIIKKEDMPQKSWQNWSYENRYNLLGIAALIGIGTGVYIYQDELSNLLSTIPMHTKEDQVQVDKYKLEEDWLQDNPEPYTEYEKQYDSWIKNWSKNNPIVSYADYSDFLAKQDNDIIDFRDEHKSLYIQHENELNSWRSKRDQAFDQIYLSCQKTM